MTEDNPLCPSCGSPNSRTHGYMRAKHWDSRIYQCLDCNKFYTIRLEERVPKKQEPSYFEPAINPQNPISWPDYNRAQINEKLLFLDILEELCDKLPEEPIGIGRPRAKNSEMVFSMVTKLYEGLSSRRVSSDLQIAMQRGHIEKVPAFTTILKYFNDPSLTPLLTRLIEVSALPLKDIETTFAVDASGLSSAFYSRWFDYRWGHLDGREGKAHNWLKIHVICGVKSNIVTSIIVTDGKSSDCPRFPALVKKTAENFRVKEVCADKGYHSRDNIDAAFEVGAVPYIPFKVGSTGKARGSKAWRKMFLYFQLHREEFMARYHQRSNVESTFSSLKRKFSGKLMFKNEVAQVNEALAKLLCHNICVLVREAYENGISTEFEHKFFCLNTKSEVQSASR